MDITITPAEMKALEQAFMGEFAVPSALLMEHAAQGVCSALERYIPNGRALFLCGPGNNGGDGYAAARLWAAGGGQALVWELSSPQHGDAGMNRSLALQTGVPMVTLQESPSALPVCDAVVDALFGTGLCRPLQGAAAVLADLVNAAAIPVIAVDIPSGLSGLDGTALGAVIHATETVTFHRIKQGLLLRDAPACTGRITVHPILIPPLYGTQEGLFCMNPEDLSLIPKRSVQAHKGDLGRVVIFAGSPGMAGAAAFCANACVKAGAGLTQILCRREILPILQTLAPGATCLPLPEQDGFLAQDAAQTAAAALQRADAAAIGCGLGQSDDLLPVLSAFRDASCPVVWDADALNLLARHRDMLPLPENAVITPHLGEAARLLHLQQNARTVSDTEPLAEIRMLHKLCGCCVLLKGARTLMTDGTRFAVNRYGTPAMAKGGSGDILTGILAALLSRDMPCGLLEKIQLAALIHGLAGIRAQKLAGENCVTPAMMIDHIRLDASGL